MKRLLQGIPMKAKHIKLIEQGKKTTTLRSLKYHYPFKKRLLIIPNDITPEIVKSEGYESKEALIKELKSMRHKLPKKMWLYDLRKPLRQHNEGKIK